MDKIDIRFRTSVAGTYETRPGIAEVLAYYPDETHSIDAELAAKWIGSGIAEKVEGARTIEVEQATREPRAERAMLRRRHR